MKPLFFFFTLSLWISVSAQRNQWAWMGGENCYAPAQYGTKGVADSANRPGIRTGSASWKDAAGNFWLFGGLGYAESTSGNLNDLWKFDPATKWWTWISGDSIAKQNAVYGTKGMASPGNKPGAFAHAVSWTDAQGSVWVYTNVLWKYDPALNQWAWINGDTATNAVYGIRGVASAANKPGTVNWAGWKDGSGNLWLYGNVLWKYNIAADTWTWMQGDTVKTTTVYGLKGVPSSTNTPGTRREVTAWTDAFGKFWLFGGYGKVNTRYYYRSGEYYTDGNINDLWNYDPGTNLWTWVSGDTVLYAGGSIGTVGTAAPTNKPGALSSAISWTDTAGNCWFFGGYTFQPFRITSTSIPFNDLWKYTPSTNLWTCVYTTSSFIFQDSFKVQKVESPDTKPSSRYDGAGWTDSSGNFWIFGGTAYQLSPSYYMNDLLRFNPKTNLWSLENENRDGKRYNLYGQKGVASAENMPGGRHNATSWTDAAGNVWLFGGLGYSDLGYAYYLNDVWKKDSAGIWTWISPSANPVPSPRQSAATWKDASGNIWLFGGRSSSKNLNDLWKYDISTNEWTQLSGDTRPFYGLIGKPGTIYRPYARRNATTWQDDAGNLWLFGGGGEYYYNYFTEFNDLWSYNPATREWTWFSGDSIPGALGVYGTKGIPHVANQPRVRQAAVSWTDKSNNIWIFGGYNSRESSNYNSNYQYLNDLWKYNPATKIWTWMGGDNVANVKGIYGTMGTPGAANKPGSRYDAISWTDTTGNLWLFGGEATGEAILSTGNFLNDLWSYDVSTNQWTWAGGDSSFNKTGVAGKQGTASAPNKPGARGGSVTWKDKAGNIWLMGGLGYSVKGGGYLNDQWKFALTSAAALPVKFISFTAVAQSNTVTLNWQTAEEQNCAYYAIERSHDGVGFTPIATATAVNNSQVISNYAVIDPQPFGDINYYRINQVDIDGKHSYSAIRKVAMHTAGFNYTIIPNPVGEALKINLQSNQSGQLQLEVRDIAGHLLISAKQTLTPGQTTHTIPVKQLAPGTYLLNISSGKTSVTKKFVRQR